MIITGLVLVLYFKSFVKEMEKCQTFYDVSLKNESNKLYKRYSESDNWIEKN